jgi:uncharacterized protein
MGSALEVIQQAYAAYGRRDVPALLHMISEPVDWEFVGPVSLSYAGRRQHRDDVASFFSALASADDTQIFEPREFIEAGEHVTVLGWAKVLALDTGMPFESEWVHVFTVRDGKVVRWRGFANTAARYGH